MIYSVHTLSDSTYRSCKKKQSCFISVFITLFQPLSIKHYFNVVSTLKQQLSFFNHISTLKVGHVPAGYVYLCALRITTNFAL